MNSGAYRCRRLCGDLKTMATAENLKVEDEALVLVARQSTGSMRDAISLLDQLASGGQEISLEMAQTVLGTAASQSVINLVEALTARQAAGGLDQIHQALDAGSDPRQYARQVVDYLRGLLLVSMNNANLVDASADVRSQMARQAASFQAPDLLRVIRFFNHAANDARSAWQPALPLEVAFISALEMPAEADTEMPAPAARKPAAASQPQAQPVPAAVRNPPADEGAAPGSAEENLVVEGGVTVKQVSENWKQILAALHILNKPTEALLRSGRLLGVKNGMVYVGFSEVLKAKAEKSENNDLLLKAFRKVFGMDIPVQYVVYTGAAGSLPPDIDSDGMVATALRDLGGEIVDVQ